MSNVGEQLAADIRNGTKDWIAVPGHTNVDADQAQALAVTPTLSYYCSPAGTCRWASDLRHACGICSRATYWLDTVRRMPARSDPFQEMVALLTQVMREDDSMTVTPSAMLTDLITGDEREVDIYVETVVAGHPVNVGIECRAHKRPQGSTWVETIRGSHADLPVHVTVLVSKSGFYKPALVKASHYGIETITPGEITPGFVGAVVNNLDKVVTKRAHFQVKTVLLQVRMGGGDLKWVEAFPDSPIYAHDGTELDNVGFIVRGIVDGNPAQRAHLQSATENDKFMNIQTPGPTYNGKPVCIITVKNGKELPPTPIEGVRIEGPVKLDLVEVPLTHGEFDGTPYSSGAVPFDGMRVSVVATESGDGNAKWAGSVTLPGGAQKMF
jgi:hypothetical protein